MNDIFAWHIARTCECWGARWDRSILLKVLSRLCPDSLPTLLGNRCRESSSMYHMRIGSIRDGLRSLLGYVTLNNLYNNSPINPNLKVIHQLQLGLSHLFNSSQKARVDWNSRAFIEIFDLIDLTSLIFLVDDLLLDVGLLDLFFLLSVGLRLCFNQLSLVYLLLTLKL